MLLQQSPFRGEDEDEIYDAILADEPLYPIHMPRDSVSILQKLLTREPELRLGSGPTDAQEIMSHAFFRNINWDDVYHKRIPAPFMPQISNPTDTSNFDSEFTSVTPVLTPVQSGTCAHGFLCFVSLRLGLGKSKFYACRPIFFSLFITLLPPSIFYSLLCILLSFPPPLFFTFSSPFPVSSFPLSPLSSFPNKLVSQSTSFLLHGVERVVILPPFTWTALLS